MREHFQEVLDLQLQHSSQNTPAMARRGDLIRNIIPGEMRNWSAASSGATRPFRGRLNVQGRDGTGLKTFVPWVRIHSPELSPSAQSGWYVVYLFRADGSGVHLCVGHGSTRFDGGDFKPRSRAEAESLMAWGRGLIGLEAQSLGFDVGVNLGSSEKLSKAYESTTAFSKFYVTGAIPRDEQLAADAEVAVSLVSQLYRASELGRGPDSTPPEISAALTVVDDVARPKMSATKTGGQGFGLTHDERCLVEQHAMDLAMSWLLQNGFETLRDVHATHSCDFLGIRDGTEHVIEVKGTTSGGGKVLLTANEVRLHSQRYPHNVLIIVHGIELHELRAVASGGTVRAIEAWDINESILEPLSYACRLPEMP
jgi:hypothetical protein